MGILTRAPSIHHFSYQISVRYFSGFVRIYYCMFSIWFHFHEIKCFNKSDELIKVHLIVGKA